ncbi:MAG: helix-turn-helix transcriptional regulator [Candidatus Limnocylindria bacterium]
MRADRLVAALLILQARGRVSAGELARELEVSEKTARRDLEALAMAGVPVYSQPGRNGGWSLLGGGRTDLSGLSASEARALFLLVGPAATASPQLKAALRKLVQALPAPFRADATAAASATLIDTSEWGGQRSAPPPHLEPLRQAVVDGVQVRLGYRGRDGVTRRRRVHPLGVVNKGSAWYLLAGTDAASADSLRTFRVDRVGSVVPLADAVDRPPGFDLEQAWAEAAARVEHRRRRERALVRVSSTVLGWLRLQFGEDLQQSRALADGRMEAEIHGGSAEWLADHLAGWGGDVEVVGPASVRQAMARIGRELVDRYEA